MSPEFAPIEAAVFNFLAMYEEPSDRVLAAGELNEWIVRELTRTVKIERAAAVNAWITDGGTPASLAHATGLSLSRIAKYREVHAREGEAK